MDEAEFRKRASPVHHEEAARLRGFREGISAAWTAVRRCSPDNVLDTLNTITSAGNAGLTGGAVNAVMLPLRWVQEALARFPQDWSLRIGLFRAGGVDRVPHGWQAQLTEPYVTNQEAYAIGTAYLDAQPEGARDMRAPIDIGLKLIAQLKARGFQITRETCCD